MRSPSVAALLLIMFSSGCAITPAMQEAIAERELEGRARLEAAATRQREAQEVAVKRERELFDRLGVECRKYGFKEGTDFFALCLQIEINNMKTRDVIEREGWLIRNSIPSK